MAGRRHGWHMGRAALLALLPALPAAAQTVNQGALDALTPARPSHPTPARPAQRPATPQAQARPAPPKPAQAAQQPVPAPPAKPPAVPTTPPAIAAIPPAVAVPMSRPPPLPSVPVAADAPGEAVAIPGGLRVTFGSERAELNPGTADALRTLARKVKEDGAATVSVLATAAGTPDDPSTPRRLSLSRAMAARAVLLNEGVPSTRIYVRALGSNGPEGPADRVDLTVAGPGGNSGSGPAARAPS